MTRQQEAENRLVDALYERHGGRAEVKKERGLLEWHLRVPIYIQAIRRAIAADPTLLEVFGEHRSQTITQAAHGSSQLTDLERDLLGIGTVNLD